MRSNTLNDLAIGGGAAAFHADAIQVAALLQNPDAVVRESAHAGHTVSRIRQAAAPHAAAIVACCSTTTGPRCRYKAICIGVPGLVWGGCSTPRRHHRNGHRLHASCMYHRSSSSTSARNLRSRCPSRSGCTQRPRHHRRNNHQRCRWQHCTSHRWHHRTCTAMATEVVAGAMEV